MFAGLDLYYSCTDPSHLITGGWHQDDVSDLSDLCGPRVFDSANPASAEADELALRITRGAGFAAGCLELATVAVLQRVFV